MITPKAPTPTPAAEELPLNPQDVSFGEMLGQPPIDPSPVQGDAEVELPKPSLPPSTTVRTVSVRAFVDEQLANQR